MEKKDKKDKKDTKPKPVASKQREKLDKYLSELESEAASQEEKAEYAEKAGVFRKRITDAHIRLNVARPHGLLGSAWLPQGRTIKVLLGLLALIVVILMTRACG